MKGAGSGRPNYGEIARRRQGGSGQGDRVDRGEPSGGLEVAWGLPEATRRRWSRARRWGDRPQCCSGEGLVARSGGGASRSQGEGNRGLGVARVPLQ